VNGFLLVSDYAYISYVKVDTTTWGLSKSNFRQSFTATSIYRTVKNPDMSDGDKFLNKKLIGVRLTYDPIPSLDDGVAQVVLKYKVDGGSFVTIFTDTTIGSFFKEMSNAGNESFTDGREYEFQIESNGVVVTGLAYKYAVTTSVIL